MNEAHKATLIIEIMIMYIHHSQILPALRTLEMVVIFPAVYSRPMFDL
ncbi:uncharacterized protein CLUP02_07661 [Colletotrichum lupini]|uniref:Uncharacterized protein n=1 Tax=Colletotrichum lupini TaxID=145971 RepID=A0A9Q8WGW7_9PEZI|nr:uncharacterized protein CLUP02_07661 [Colletotrichum lupini]UQC82175.1 hypothetical protein CLUP02_07661 [Colletotrichum lupini]